MKNLLILSGLGMVSFLAGMSIAFSILSWLIDENTLFQNNRCAIVTFITGICSGILLTIFSIKGVCYLECLIN